MTQHKNVTRVLRMLKGALKAADADAKGVAATVTLTRHEVTKAITDLTDVDARGQLEPSALKRRRAARKAGR